MLYVLPPCHTGWTYDCPQPNTTGCIPNGEIVINNLSLGGYTVREREGEGRGIQVWRGQGRYLWRGREKGEREWGERVGRGVVERIGEH